MLRATMPFPESDRGVSARRRVAAVAEHQRQVAAARDLLGVAQGRRQVGERRFHLRLRAKELLAREALQLVDVERRDPAAAVIVSHELPSSTHESGSLPGVAKTAAIGTNAAASAVPARWLR